MASPTKTQVLTVALPPSSGKVLLLERPSGRFFIGRKSMAFELYKPGFETERNGVKCIAKVFELSQLDDAEKNGWSFDPPAAKKEKRKYTKRSPLGEVNDGKT